MVPEMVSWKAKLMVLDSELQMVLKSGNHSDAHSVMMMAPSMERQTERQSVLHSVLLSVMSLERQSVWT